MKGELSFLIDLLLNQKSWIKRKKLIEERINWLEGNASYSNGEMQMKPPLPFTKNIKKSKSNG